jgi:hypothetical protein
MGIHQIWKNIESFLQLEALDPAYEGGFFRLLENQIQAHEIHQI